MCCIVVRSPFRLKYQLKQICKGKNGVQKDFPFTYLFSYRWELTPWVQYVTHSIYTLPCIADLLVKYTGLTPNF